MSSTVSVPKHHSYRIGKFDPLASASERAGDWTSISDIGKRFGGRTLTRRHYEQVEHKYVEALRLMVASSGVRELVVSDVQWAADSAPADPIDTGMVVAPETAVEVCRAQLREELSCHLEARNGFAIDVGFDLYLYITSPVALDEDVAAIREMGLFIECGVPSPYFME